MTTHYFIRAGWGSPSVMRLSRDKHGWPQWSCDPQSATRFTEAEAREALAQFCTSRDGASLEPAE